MRDSLGECLKLIRLSLAARQRRIKGDASQLIPKCFIWELLLRAGRRLEIAGPKWDRSDQLGTLGVQMKPARAPFANCPEVQT